jgi:peptide-methionine (S)-S-oxide reductase
MSNELATLGAGCFWCVEAVFDRLRGVESVMPGYTGGQNENPTYEQICTGTTGHAEVLQVSFDPEIITFSKLLEVFFKIHDPTTLNRQGADAGTQYRSSIFFHNDEQEAQSKEIIAKLDESGAYNDPIVTEVTKLEKYWPAENYHKDYFANNPENQYCQLVVRPKVEKFAKVFADISK